MGESQNVEWKASWRDEYLKWICGFANADGGVLVIGRNDGGDAVGVGDARQLLETLPNKVRDLLGIVAACAEAGVPVPQLQYEQSGLWITFPFAVRQSGREEESDTTQIMPPKTLGKTTQKTTQKILQILREKPEVGRREIAEILGDITEDGVKYQLNKMKQEGLIERIGPAKGGHWKVLEDRE